MDCRKTNLYRNLKVPAAEPLSYTKYIGEYNSKSQVRRDKDWNEIIKPILQDENL